MSLYALSANGEESQKMTRYGGRVVYVTEQTDQFQKFGKNMARKYKLKKSDLNQKHMIYIKKCSFIF